MFNAPTNMMNMPQGMNFVTKLKTKILQAMDYVLQCRNDEEALNGWRLLCSHGVAMVRLAVEDDMFTKAKLKNPDTWKALSEAILSEWPIKTFEKTDVVRETDGYRGLYDGYCVEVRSQDLDLGLRSLDKEKYNVIANKLMAFWGDCYSIALAVGYLNLEEEIEIPVKMDDRYTSESMRRGSQKWVTKDDGQRGDSQAPHVEGRGTSH